MNDSLSSNTRGLLPAKDVLWHLREATREAELLVRGGIIEIAVRNPSVAEYMKHWEGRAMKAEAELAQLKGVAEYMKHWEGRAMKAEAELAQLKGSVPETDAARLSAWQKEHGAPLPDELEALQKDADRYRFLRQGEDTLDTEDEAAFADMWEAIGMKGNWRERMDCIVDAAMDRAGSGKNGNEHR